jgi:hypothetical protein
MVGGLASQVVRVPSDKKRIDMEDRVTPSEATFWTGSFRPYEEWADEAERTPDFLIEGLLHQATNGLSGKPSVGKTRLAAAMAAAVAKGDRKFCGRKVNDHGPVMIVSSDAGEAGRWGMRMREHDVKRSVVGIARFKPNNWDEYQDHARRCKLLVVDNLSGILGEDTITDDAAARKLLGPLTEIAENGTTILLLAHSAKNSEAMSGRITPTGTMGSTVYQAWERLNIHIRDVTEPDTRFLQVVSNDAPLQKLTVTATWGDASADWKLLREEEDKRMRTEETFGERLDLFALVANDPELSKMKTMAAVGRELRLRELGPWQNDKAAEIAFSRAKRAAGGEFRDGRWARKPVG